MLRISELPGCGSRNSRINRSIEVAARLTRPGTDRNDRRNFFTRATYAIVTQFTQILLRPETLGQIF